MNKGDLFSEYDSLCESYLNVKTRMYYPRNFKLSDEFVKALDTEVQRLERTGENRKKILAKLTKSLRFHI